MCGTSAIDRLRGCTALLAVTLCLALAACSGSTPATVPTASGAASSSSASQARLVIQSHPLQLSLQSPGGRTVLSTLPAQPKTLPSPLVIADLTQPTLDLDPGATDAPFGWVSGTRVQRQIASPPFQGNQLFFLDAGTFVAATGVVSRKTASDGSTVLMLSTNDPAAGDATLTIHRLPDGSYRLDLSPPAKLPDVVSTLIGFASPTSEGLYGLGARKDAFNQRGTFRNVWSDEENIGTGPLSAVTAPLLGRDYTFPNGAQAAYFVESALFGSRGWGAWVTQPQLSRLDLAASDKTAIRWLVATPKITLVLNGNGLAAASKAFTDYYGRAPAPPAYVYQPWIDVINQGEGEAAPLGAGFTGGARVKRDVQTVVKMAQQDDLPIGVIGMEGWQSVPDIADFAASLRAQGYHLSGYWNPFVSASQTPDSPGHDAAYAQAEARHYFITNAQGGDYQITSNRGSKDLLLDFSNPQVPQFWAGQIDRMFNLGIEAFMEDFGEYTSQGMHFANGEPPNTEHNAYPVQYHAAGAAAVRAYAASHPGFHPFFYVRSGFNGVCADTPAVFPGDETTDFSPASGLPSVIPAMLNLALTGCYAFTTDVGGYFDLLSPRTSKQLLIRWSQLTAFTPIMRIHDSTYHHSVYPWSFDAQTVDIFRRYARAKVKLIPLVNAWAQRAAADGTIGPVRPLVLDDDSPAARSIDSEWLLGNNLLVAPVITQNATARSVYFPAHAQWAQVVPDDNGNLVPTGAVYNGGTSASIAVTLANIPLFKRQ